MTLVNFRGYLDGPDFGLIDLPNMTTPGIPSVFREVELRKAALELLVSIAEDGNYTREDESKVGNAMQALQNILDT